MLRAGKARWARCFEHGSFFLLGPVCPGKAHLFTQTASLPLALVFETDVKKEAFFHLVPDFIFSSDPLFYYSAQAAGRTPC